ncbi:MAG: signal recognition particle subunit SRP54 [Pseudoalteromonas tetraodonis]|jgi:signal recognition particle subunit SRP54
MMNKMGSMTDLIGMLPGAGKLKGLNVDPKAMKRVEAIVLSMTPEERERPELINGKRRKRLAHGSGNTIIKVNQFLKQFGMMRKMMKSKGKMKKMMQQLGGEGGGFPGM